MSCCETYNNRSTETTIEYIVTLEDVWNITYQINIAIIEEIYIKTCELNQAAYSIRSFNSNTTETHQSTGFS